MLVGEPYFVSLSEIGTLTDRQLALIYFRPKKRERIPEPQSEDDVRAWCASVKDNFDIPDSEYAEWVERAVAAWRKEKRGEEAG